MLRIRDVSRILIFTHPRSRIPDPKTATKEGWKKMFCQTFFFSHKFHKIVNYFMFEMLKKKNLGQFFTQFYNFIFPHPGSRIPNPKTATKEGWKKNCQTFFYSHKFHKIVNFMFEMLKKKIWANVHKIIQLFTQKIVIKLSKTCVWDPGSMGQKGIGSRIRIRNTECFLVVFSLWHCFFFFSGLGRGGGGGGFQYLDPCKAVKL